MNDKCIYCHFEKIDGIDATVDEEIKDAFICTKHKERFERQTGKRFEQAQSK